MKRVPTMSINSNGISMAKIIPHTLGDTLSFAVDTEKKQIIVSKEPGEHMALVVYPEMIPIIKSVHLTRWIKKELGERNYSKMIAEYDGEKFIVQTGDTHG